MENFIPLPDNMFALVKEKNYFRFCRAIAVSNDLMKVMVYSSIGILDIYPLRPRVDGRTYSSQLSLSETCDPDKIRVIRIFHIDDIDAKTDEFWQVELDPYIKKEGLLTLPDGRCIEIQAEI